MKNLLLVFLLLLSGCSQAQETYPGETMGELVDEIDQGIDAYYEERVVAHASADVPEVQAYNDVVGYWATKLATLPSESDLAEADLLKSVQEHMAPNYADYEEKVVEQCSFVKEMREMGIKNLAYGLHQYEYGAYWQRALFMRLCFGADTKMEVIDGTVILTVTDHKFLKYQDEVKIVIRHSEGHDDWRVVAVYGIDVDEEGYGYERLGAEAMEYFAKYSRFSLDDEQRIFNDAEHSPWLDGVDVPIDEAGQSMQTLKDSAEVNYAEAYYAKTKLMEKLNHLQMRVIHSDNYIVHGGNIFETDDHRTRLGHVTVDLAVLDQIKSRQ